MYCSLSFIFFFFIYFFFFFLSVLFLFFFFFFFFSSRRRHTRWNCDWSSDVCSSDLACDGAACMTMSMVRRHGSDCPMSVRRFSAASWARSERFSWTSDRRSEERRVGKECRSRWSPDH